MNRSDDTSDRSPMTYGQLLNQIATALAHANASIDTTPTPPLEDQIAVAVARAKLYQALYQQVVLIGGTRASRLARELDRATARTASLLDTPAPAAPSTPVAIALQRAAWLAEQAGAILASHLAPGPADNPTATHARTTAAAALQAGHGRSAALHRIGALVTAATALDGQLGVWLARHRIVAAAIADVDRTSSGLLPRTAASATAATHRPSFLDNLATATSLPNTEVLPPIRSAHDAYTAFDAGRDWLLQHRNELHAADLTVLTRVGLGLSHELAYLLHLLGLPIPIGPAGYLANLWRDATRTLDKIRDVTPTRPGPGTTAVLNAERWLHHRLRHGGQWRSSRHLIPTDAAATAWRDTTEQFAARLPDLASLTAHGIHAAVTNNTLAQQRSTGLRSTGGKLVVNPIWQRATARHGPAADLLQTVRTLRLASEWPAIVADTPPLPGLYEVVEHSRARLVGERVLTYQDRDMVTGAIRALNEHVHDVRRRIRHQARRPALTTVESLADGGPPPQQRPADREADNAEHQDGHVPVLDHD